MLKVLFLCTGNSCRSQMAEGFARHLKGDLLEAYSAGIETHGLDPNAVRVMAEAGVDISGHRSNHVDEYRDVDFDYVVTVCGHAHESCPSFPGRTRVVHVGFDDPPRLARGAASEEEALGHYWRVRDEIRAFVETLPEGLRGSTAECPGSDPGPGRQEGEGRPWRAGLRDTRSPGPCGGHAGSRTASLRLVRPTTGCALHWLDGAARAIHTTKATP